VGGQRGRSRAPRGLGKGILPAAAQQGLGNYPYFEPALWAQNSLASAALQFLKQPVARTLRSCIQRSASILRDRCFYFCSSLRPASFESDSKLGEIFSHVFSNCSSLGSVCIPNFVALLRGWCFDSCKSPSTLIFDPIQNKAVFASVGCSG
jgi:hypothetical protein